MNAVDGKSWSGTNVRGRDRAEKGNYRGYNGYRNSSSDRIKQLPMEILRDSVCLDIGCNSGELTVEIARQCRPRHILGIDVDHGLIKKAQSLVSRLTPDIAASRLLPRVLSTTSKRDKNGHFPRNVEFRAMDVMDEYQFSKLLNVESPSFSLSLQGIKRRAFEIVICMSVTKV